MPVLKLAFVRIVPVLVRGSASSSTGMPVLELCSASSSTGMPVLELCCRNCNIISDY